MYIKMVLPQLIWLLTQFCLFVLAIYLLIAVLTDILKGTCNYSVAFIYNKDAIIFISKIIFCALSVSFLVPFQVYIKNMTLQKIKVSVIPTPNEKCCLKENMTHYTY
jgi:hypothetical protein